MRIKDMINQDDFSCFFFLTIFIHYCYNKCMGNKEGELVFTTATTYSLLANRLGCDFCFVFFFSCISDISFFTGSLGGDHLSRSHLLQSCILKGDFHLENKIEVCNY